MRNPNNYIFSVALSVLLFSCKISSPTFKNISQWQISNISAANVTLSNTAYFNNPNKLEGMKLNNLSVEISTNKRKLGTITNPSGRVIIPGNSDFEVPLSLNIPLVDLLGNLGTIVDMAIGKTIDIRCNGHIEIGYGILNKNIHFDQTLPVNISELKKIGLF